MPKLDNQPCGVDVPCFSIGNVTRDGKAICRRRDFSVWLTRTALLTVASKDQWGDDAWAEECADAWLALPPKAWGWQ